jgi:hypothetical protein
VSGCAGRLDASGLPASIPGRPDDSAAEVIGGGIPGFVSPVRTGIRPVMDVRGAPGRATWFTVIIGEPGSFLGRHAILISIAFRCQFGNRS